MKLIQLTLTLSVCLLLIGCQSTLTNQDALPTSAPEDWLAWKAKRHESIAGTNGWLTLIGRHWLDEGANSVGRNPSNHIVIRSERAPESIGILHRQGRSVRMDLTPGIQGRVSGKPALPSIELQSDHTPTPTLLTIGDLKFLIIDRGDRIGLRVRDPHAPARDRFTGLTYFPYNPAWRITGKFERYPTPRSIQLDTIIGNQEEFISPGAIHFSHHGKDYSLDVVEEDGVEDYFVLFKDQTNGGSTYAAGRFLYVTKPSSNGQVIIDFNRAYTPPCGFTPYATCPLAPKQNGLPFKIQAGERAPSGVTEH